MVYSWRVYGSKMDSIKVKMRQNKIQKEVPQTFKTIEVRKVSNRRCFINILNIEDPEITAKYSFPGVGMIETF